MERKITIKKTYFLFLGAVLCMFIMAFVPFKKPSDNANSHGSILLSCASPVSNTEKVACLAETFKATLSASQVSTVQLTYTQTNAANWSNLPQALVQTKRVGIQLGTLSATQLTAAKALLKEAMGTVSNEGYGEVEQLLAADDYLGTVGGGTTYSAGNYFMAFLGTPSLTGTWELQFGGHHLAVANTYKNGKLVGATPSFRAVEPSTAFTMGTATVQPMEQERVAMASAISGLSASEATTAKFSSTFSDILLGPGKDGQFPSAKSGLKVGTLSATQKNLILNVIKTYVQDMEDENAAKIMARYTAELDETYIGYSGTGTMATQGDYFRLDGPNVWIEYSTQGGIVIRGTPHPHSIWRDRTTDYGTTGSVTANEDKSEVVNEKSKLNSNYPNPFLSATTIPFSLTEDSHVKIEIFDMLGKKVETVVNQTMSRGDQNVSFNRGRLSSGSYVYRITTTGNNRTTSQSNLMFIQ